jgi:hypothetical protein
MAISYPVGAIVSMVVSGRLFDRLSDLGRLRMFVGQHALAVACLQVLCMAPSSGVLMTAAMAGTMMGVAPTIFLAPSALVTRYECPEQQPVQTTQRLRLSVLLTLLPAGTDDCMAGHSYASLRYTGTLVGLVDVPVRKSCPYPACADPAHLRPPSAYICTCFNALSAAAIGVRRVTLCRCFSSSRCVF